MCGYVCSDAADNLSAVQLQSIYTGVVLLQGKMSRILAAKAALATRVDAMGSSDDATIGLESRAKVFQVPNLSRAADGLH